MEEYEYGFYDEYGRWNPVKSRRKRDRQERRYTRRVQRAERKRSKKLDRYDRRDMRAEEKAEREEAVAPMGWVRTTVSGRATGTDSAVSITISPGVEFRAEKITFAGSTAGGSVRTVTFADVLAWQAQGMAVEALTADSTFAPELKGYGTKPGQDITITGDVVGTGSVLAVSISGWKPANGGQAC